MMAASDDGYFPQGRQMEQVGFTGGSQVFAGIENQGG